MLFCYKSQYQMGKKRSKPIDVIEFTLKREPYTWNENIHTVHITKIALFSRTARFFFVQQNIFHIHFFIITFSVVESIWLMFGASVWLIKYFIPLFFCFIFYRLAVHNMHYVSNVLGIRDPIHKQKIALKAMDVVLFGPPRGIKFAKSL